LWPTTGFSPDDFIAVLLTDLRGYGGSSALHESDAYAINDLVCEPAPERDQVSAWAAYTHQQMSRVVDSCRG
jgi:hypothetical protein